MKLNRRDAFSKLADICRSNADALMTALNFCTGNGIGCFRINSQILPLKTHPEMTYEIEDLPGGRTIRERFRQCGQFALDNGLRTTFHPDQFVVLNSPRSDVVKKSIEELDYQAKVAEWVGADVITIHCGGVYGDKAKALKSFCRNVALLPECVRERLAVENDDKSFTPADLLPLCRAENIPLVYDVHHHRCNPDARTVEEATEQALETWHQEPQFHISSPLEGHGGPKPYRHHDFINLRDFPRCWEES